MHDSRRGGPSLVLAGLVVAWLLLVAPTGWAVTRDVEVTPGAPDDTQLVVEPAASLFADVRGQVRWPVRLANGSDVAVGLDLEVVHAVQVGDGAAVVAGPGDAPVAWSTLPRDRVVLGPGQVGTFEVLLAPTPGDLPAAVALVAGTGGDDPREVVAMAVLWPPGLEPAVDVSVGPEAVVVTSVDAPVVVDVAIRGSAVPRRSTSVAVGPLVLLPGQAERIAFTAPATVLGSRTEAVVAIDGREVARTVRESAMPAGRVALLAFAVALVLAAAGLAARRLRR